ncbi:MAG: hypothetical protein ACUVTX_06420 [Bacteroidales bacterium]
MKKEIFLIFMFIAGYIEGVFTQETPAERLYAYRVAFITKRLNLTTEEAQRFWPVYNELQKKKNAIQQERTSIYKNIAQNELNMSEKEIAEAGDRLVSLELQESNLTAEYHKKFREVLSPLKVVRLYQAENQYRVVLLNELRNNPPAIRENIQQRRIRNN